MQEYFYTVNTCYTHTYNIKSLILPHGFGCFKKKADICCR